MAIEQHTNEAERWRTEEHARNWIERMDREGRNRDEELRTLVSFLTFDPDAQIHILELGSGHGLLTRTVLEAFPRAHVLGLDLNPTMIEEGRRRLASFGNRVEYRQWDLGEPGWPAGADGPFDAVITSLALHHLQRPRKVELARQLFQRLRPGGFFLNVDHVGVASERLSERYERSRSMLDPDRRGPHGHHGLNDPVQPQLEDLRSAGFVDVDVFWKRARLALMGGTRPD